MVIAHTLTLTSANTGYSLTTLLSNAGFPINAISSPRVSSIRIQTQSADCFLVPGAGTIAVTAGVPNDYGYKITTTNEFQDFFSNQNAMSLDEFILCSNTAGAKIVLFAYTV